MDDSRRWGAFGLGSLLMALVFAAFGAVQYNDPDPVRWMTMYGGAALVSALAPFHPRKVWLAAVLVGAVALAGSALLGLHVLGQKVAWSEVFATVRMIDSNVEETREALGLLIVAAWMALVALRGGRVRPSG